MQSFGTLTVLVGLILGGIAGANYEIPGDGLLAYLTFGGAVFLVFSGIVLSIVGRVRGRHPV